MMTADIVRLTKATLSVRKFRMEPAIDRRTLVGTLWEVIPWAIQYFETETPAERCWIVRRVELQEGRLPSSQLNIIRPQKGNMIRLSPARMGRWKPMPAEKVDVTIYSDGRLRIEWPVHHSPISLPSYISLYGSGSLQR